MTFQQLRYFVAVAQYLHFGEAAKACFISQPSLSHSIMDLETELNLKLLYRENRTISLTEAGKVFFDEAQEIIQKVDDAIIKARRAGAGYSGTLHIGALGGLSSENFLSTIAAFKKEYPEVELDFTQTNMATLNLCLLKGSFDVVLSREIDVRQRCDELTWQTLYQDCFGILTPKGYSLSKLENTNNLSCLCNEPFVFLKPSVTPNIYKYIKQLCISRNLVMKEEYPAPTLEILCTLVKAGMGIAIVPDCAMNYSNGGLDFVPLQGEDALSNVVLAWRKKNMNPIVPTFLNKFHIINV